MWRVIAEKARLGGETFGRTSVVNQNLILPAASAALLANVLDAPPVTCGATTHAVNGPMKLDIGALLDETRVKGVRHELDLAKRSPPIGSMPTRPRPNRPSLAGSCIKVAG